MSIGQWCSQHKAIGPDGSKDYSRVKDLPKKLGLDFPRYECGMLPGCDINMLHPWKYDNNVKLLSQQPKVCVRKLRRRMAGLKPLLSGFCCLVFVGLGLK